MNNTLCDSEEEVFRVKVLGFYIYFLMIINTSLVVWHTLGNYSENNLKKDKNNFNCEIDEDLKKRKWFFSNKIE